MPQYMLLLYPPVDQVPAADALSRYEAFEDALDADDAFVTSGRLQTLESATAVRVRGDDTLISDGPFAETKEYLAGFYLLDCDDLDAALAHAARVPLAETGTVEVRPVMFPAGTKAREMRTQAEA